MVRKGNLPVLRVAVSLKLLKSFVVEYAVLNVVISEIKVDYPRADMWH